MFETTFEMPLTPERIVEKNIVLNVPIYQRLFVWRTDQIRNLLSDLYRACTDDSPNAYNIGVVSVWANPAERGAWDLVDGQQRLTFLSLFAAWAVSNLQNLQKESKAAEAWRKFLFVGVEKMRLHFFGRPEDEKAIKDYSSGKIPQNGSFGIFARTAEEFLKGKECDWEKFAGFVYSYCSFLADALPEGYGPHELNLHFERMNSTGRQLEPIDIVKGLFFSAEDLSKEWNIVFRTNGQSIHEETSIAKIISANNSNINDKDDENTDAGGEKSETERLVSDETLLLHSLRLASADTGVSLDKSRLLETFDHYVGKRDGAAPITANSVIEALKEYSAWMDRHIVRMEKDDRGGCNKFVFVSDKAEDIDFDENTNGKEHCFSAERRMLKQFESMLYVSSDDSQSWILEAYLRSNKSFQNEDALLTILKTIDISRHELSEQAMREKRCWSYGTIDRYWFWKLDYLLWERHEQNKRDDLFSCLRDEDHDAIGQFTFRRDRSIEHLHPRNPPPTGEGDDWKEDHEKHGNTARDGFGNLAMISSSFNSSQGNDSISTKMGRIDDQVREKRLQSIKLLLMVRSVQSNPQGWTVKAACDHEEQMFKLLSVD